MDIIGKVYDIFIATSRSPAALMKNPSALPSIGGRREGQQQDASLGVARGAVIVERTGYTTGVISLRFSDGASRMIMSKRKATNSNGSSPNLEFQAKVWAGADALDVAA
jgi:hypothetical protein